MKWKVWCNLLRVLFVSSSRIIEANGQLDRNVTMTTTLWSLSESSVAVLHLYFILYFKCSNIFIINHYGLVIAEPWTVSFSHHRFCRQATHLSTNVVNGFWLLHCITTLDDSILSLDWGAVLYKWQFVTILEQHDQTAVCLYRWERAIVLRWNIPHKSIFHQLNFLFGCRRRCQHRHRRI